MKNFLFKVFFRSSIYKYWERANYIASSLKAVPLFKKSLTLKQTTSTLTDDRFKGKRVLLPLIETSHYKSIQLLIIAKALNLRGCDVFVLVCDQALSACEIRSVQRSGEGTCWKCRFNKRKLLPLFGLKTISMADILSDINENYLQELDRIKTKFPEIHRCVEDSVTRYFYGNVPDDQDTISLVREKYLMTCIHTWLVAEKVHANYDINLVLGYMVAYSEFEPYYAYFSGQNVDFKIVSSTQFNGKAQIFNWPELYHSMSRFDRYLKSRSKLDLMESERKILFEFINRRKKGIDPVLAELGIAKIAATDLTRFGIEIDKRKKNIFLFSNVFWDVGMSELNTFFPSIERWVFETVRIVAEIPDCTLYIRCHPAEKLNSENGKRGMQEIILDHFGKLPENVSIISSDNEVSSYDLFPHIDLGLIYNGTIGLEMLLEDIPVVVAGKAPYSGLKSAQSPKNIEEYTACLCVTKNKGQIDKREVQLFAYFYLIKTSIPWNLTKKAYPADLFDPFEFISAEELLPDGDKYLDHICNCLVDNNISPEAW